MSEEIKVIRDPLAGYDGGYRVLRGDAEIGTVERYFPVWERRSKGKRYVNARGMCKRPVFRVGTGRYGYPTLKDAVAAIVETTTGASA